MPPWVLPCMARANIHDCQALHAQGTRTCVGVFKPKWAMVVGTGQPRRTNTCALLSQRVVCIHAGLRPCMGKGRWTQVVPAAVTACMARAPYVMHHVLLPYIGHLRMLLHLVMAPPLLHQCATSSVHTPIPYMRYVHCDLHSHSSAQLSSGQRSAAEKWQASTCALKWYY